LRYLAVDLGATSVRVSAAVFDDDGGCDLEVIHRAAHRPLRDAQGGLRWEWDAILREVETGLLDGAARGPVAGIGVDTWGVDYGLLDTSGRLLSSPWSYRSERTHGWRDVADRIGIDRLYATTGIQLMEINTIFQLAAHDRAELARADRLLMLPELVVHHLTGAALGEVSSAGTTGLLDARGRDWSPGLLEAIGVERDLLPDLAPVGTVAGEWHGMPVRLVAGHDTASAVAGLPQATAQRSAFICTGSWVLVGAQLDQPNLSPAAQGLNFSNEPDPTGGVRLLKNVPGFVGLEELRESLSMGSVADLVAHPDHQGAVDAVVDELVARIVAVLGELAPLIGGPVQELRLVGGGVHIRPFVERLRDASGVPVVVGSSEATSVGNARIQYLCHNASD
jgi:rhamnulokinase